MQYLSEVITTVNRKGLRWTHSEHEKDEECVNCCGITYDTLGNSGTHVRIIFKRNLKIRE
jgi:hypothetical protein